jgi:dTDP-4-amino-4,6-dideoxygalactose transaminase
MKQIKLFHPYVNDKARKNVQRVLSGRVIAQGPLVDKFEKNFAKTFGFEPWQIVSLNSGTSALELAYDLCEIGPKDEVITPVLTCTATNIPLVRRNAKIVFGDVNGVHHLNLDALDAYRKISKRTKAVVFVHFGGNSDGLNHVEDLCDVNGLDLICDAAQALGSTLSKKARFSCVSLQAIKSLTSGDGGVLICRDKADAVKARKLRWFGYDRELKQKLGDTDLDLAGYKYHMNDISAAIVLGNLSDWKRIKSHRESINAVYAKYGKNKGYIKGIWNPCVVGISYFQTYTNCKLKGIEIGQYHYRNDKYSLFSNAKAKCPNMDAINDQYFMLPCHMNMTVKDAEKVAKIVFKDIKYPRPDFPCDLALESARAYVSKNKKI